MTTWLFGLWCAHAAIVVEPPPTEGVPSVITVTEDDQPVRGATVRVHHAYGLPRSSELAIGITDARGRVRWTPETAGLSQVQADTQEVLLSIAYASTPTEAALSWLLLGLTGVGMVLYGTYTTTARRR